MPTPVLLVIAGPFGSGKTTLVNSLCDKNGLKKCITVTTRAPRVGEVHGKDYIFMTREEFLNSLKNEMFLESAEVHGNLYGTLRETIEEAVSSGDRLILNIDVQGLESLLNHPNEAINESIISVFLDVPDEALIRRAQSRPGGMSTEEIAIRLETAKNERQASRRFDYRLLNPDGGLDDLVKNILSIIDRRTLDRECFR